MGAERGKRKTNSKKRVEKGRRKNWWEKLEKGKQEDGGLERRKVARIDRKGQAQRVKKSEKGR